MYEDSTYLQTGENQQNCTYHTRTILVPTILTPADVRRPATHGEGQPERGGVGGEHLGLYPIATSEKQLLNMIENLV